MRKLLFVVTKGNWGGAQRYVFDLAIHLREQYAVSVACGMPGKLVEQLTEESIPVHVIPHLGRDMNVFHDLRSLWEVFRLFWHERPDIVHLNSSKIGGIGAVAARLCGIKTVIFTVHGFAFNEDRPWWQKPFIVTASWLSVVFATRVICINRTECDQIKRWPLVRSKATLIYNGIDEPSFLRRSDARAQIFELTRWTPAEGTKPFIVGTIAELVSNKGIQFAIEAIAQIPESHLVIIGSGEELIALGTLAAELGGSERIHFTGFVANASTYLKGFDTFVLSSVKEGLPYVILEAGYAKLPVVSTNVGGIPDVITDMKDGILVQTRKPQELARALMFMHDHKRQGQAFAKSLHERIKQAFSTERMVNETIAAYNGTASVPPIPEQPTIY